MKFQRSQRQANCHSIPTPSRQKIHACVRMGLELTHLKLVPTFKKQWTLIVLMRQNALNFQIRLTLCWVLHITVNFAVGDWLAYSEWLIESQSLTEAQQVYCQTCSLWQWLIGHRGEWGHSKISRDQGFAEDLCIVFTQRVQRTGSNFTKKLSVQILLRFNLIYGLTFIASTSGLESQHKHGYLASPLHDHGNGQSVH